MDYIVQERLKWRSRRSLLELDLFFERFIQSGEFAQLSSQELLNYQYILTLEDGDLLLLLQGKQICAIAAAQNLINKIARRNL
jgi:antitoxin CptB